MSSALGVFAGMPVSGGLSGLDRMADFRMRRAQMKWRAAELDRQLTEMNEIINAELEGQKALVDLQITAIDGLTDAQDITTEAIQSLEDDIRESDDDRRIQYEMISGTGKAALALAELTATWLLNRAKISAGGAVGEQAGVTVLGWPWATGDIKLSHNAQSAGWLCCQGTERRRDEYPELAYWIGGKYGTASTSDFFKLPSKAQLTGDAVILNNGGVEYYIRT